jgi:hypothetical protein
MSQHKITRHMKTIMRCAVSSIAIFSFSSSVIAADADYATELQAFYAMVAELHLEKGAATPLSKDRATAYDNACRTPRLRDARNSGSAFAKIVWSGCFTVTEYYAFGPSEVIACISVDGALETLPKLEAVYASERARITTTLHQLDMWLKCSAERATAAKQRQFVSPDLVVIPARTEPILFEGAIIVDIKPLPPRPTRYEKPVAKIAAPMKETAVKNDKPVVKKKAPAKKK